MSSWPSASTIAAVTVGTAATGVLDQRPKADSICAHTAYAVWFDHKRRTDPEFRKELKRSQRRAARMARTEAEAVGAAQQEAISAALASAKEEGFPSSVEEREAYFMEQVAQGEQLANESGSEVDAAICFYKALKVYPSPSDLMGIYDKTVPKPVLDILADMIAADPAIQASRYTGSSPSSEHGIDD